MMAEPEAAASPDPSMLGWFAAGVVLCGSLIYLRQFLFWLPHPIGLVLLADNTAYCFWFSCFLAWVCKRSAVKYCDAEQYKQIRGFFIGLILGAVFAIGVATVVGLSYDPNFMLYLDAW